MTISLFLWEWWDENPPELSLRDQRLPEPTAFLADPCEWQPTGIDVQVEYEVKQKRLHLDGVLCIPTEGDLDNCHQLGLMLINRDIVVIGMWQIKRITPLISLREPGR